MVFVPTKAVSIENAIDNAVSHAKYKDCAVGLTNTDIGSFNHSFLFGSYGYIAKGRIIYDTSIKGCENIKGEKANTKEVKKAATPKEKNGRAIDS